MTADLAKTLEAMKVLAERKKYRAFDYFIPYPKQRLFYEMTATKREMLFMAANQVGKTHAGAFLATAHATGEYAPWWTGKRFNKPTRGWVAGVTSLETRNILQKKLCGEPGIVAAKGTGMIPKESLLDVSMARGITDAYDTIQVQHRTNGKKDGVSTIHFKSYEQGRSKFQGDTIDWGWGDEEPEKHEVYSEFKARLTGQGHIFITFTPLFGRTTLVDAFYDEEHLEDRGVVTMTLDEAEHFTAEEKAKRLAGYERHERDARAKGVPMLGSGAIFLTPEAHIIEPFIEHVPAYWVKLWGIDPGIDHPFGAVLLLWDRDNDVIHVHHAIRQQGTLILAQAAAMKLIGADVPVAWPQDATQRERGGGEQLATQYKKIGGLRMLDDHATWPEGGLSTEAGVQEWDEREKTGRLKIANHLQELLEERRFYHRKDGKIVKIRDDLLSAGRIALMMKRFAKAVMLGGKRPVRPKNLVAQGVDFDVF